MNVLLCVKKYTVQFIKRSHSLHIQMTIIKPPQNITSSYQLQGYILWPPGKIFPPLNFFKNIFPVFFVRLFLAVILGLY